MTGFDSFQRAARLVLLAGVCLGATATAAGAAAVPVNETLPSLAGTPQVGQVLTSTPGTWSNSPNRIVDVWLECPPSGNCGSLPGASGTTYTIQAGDVGETIEVEEFAFKGGKPTSAVFSAQVGPITAVPPAGGIPGPELVVAPTVSGTPQLAQVLTADHATWSGSPALSDQWLRCTVLSCAAVPGATGLSYTLTANDVGAMLALQETATEPDGPPSSVISAHTAMITAPSSTSLATTPSSPVADQTVTLTATVTSAASSVPPSGSLSFDRNGTAIPQCANLPVTPRAQTVIVTCQTSLATGTAGVDAAFTAGAGTSVTSSTSAAQPVAVGRAPSTTSLTVPEHPSLGKRTTYAATVTSPLSAEGPLRPSGTLTFLDGARPITGCANVPLVGGTADCRVVYTDIAHHRIQASYTGDGDFVPSQSAAVPVTAVPVTPNGYVTAFMSWTFAYEPAFTSVRAMSLTGVSSGTTLSITCAGAGCPFATRTRTFTARCVRLLGRRRCSMPGTVDLSALFRNRKLRAGTRISVRISHAHWIGKYYRFTIRAGRRPQIAESCLAISETRPGVACTSS